MAPILGMCHMFARCGALVPLMCKPVVPVCSFVNQTVTAILNTAGVTSITGDQLNTKMTDAADASQWSWVTYPWSTSSSTSVFTKRAVVGPAGTRGLAKQYYLGAGYNIKLQGTIRPV